MKYFDEMLSKYGFGDGDSAPCGVDTYREIYVTALNAFAEKFGSGVRAAAFDRAGIHNSCLIFFCPKDELAGYTRNPAKPDGIPECATEMKPDEAMNQAIYAASQLYLDDYVTVRTYITKAARKSLNAAIEDALVSEESKAS